RVYNYSVGQHANSLVVRFQAVEYDPASDADVGERETLGETIIPVLAPLANTVVPFTWDTTDFGAEPGQTKNWRIYVVLDPDTTIDEIHESEKPGTIDPGQNNEGFGLATVTNPRPAPTAKDLAKLEKQDDPSLPDDAIALLGADGRLTADATEVEVNRPVRLRI